MTMAGTEARFEVRALHPLIGAEVLGFDMAAPLTPARYEEVRALWVKHGILVFRDQTDLTPAQHIAFSRHFGALEIFTLRHFTHPEHPELFVISNIEEGGRAIGARVERIWHSDSQFLERPSMGSILHAKALPREGADTLFCDMRQVYRALPAATRARIDGLTVNHSRIRAYPQNYPKRPPLTEEEKARVPDVEHPLVRTHPESGERSLYLGHSTAPRIVGLARAESDALVAELMAFATGERFVYRHEWRLGDAVFWDNRSTNHCATDYDEVNERRLMYRTTIMGERPF